MLAAGDTEAGEIAGDEVAVLIIEDAADAFGSCASIDVVIDEIDEAFVGEMGFISKFDIAGHFSAAGAGEFSFGGEFLIFECGVFVDIDIAIHGVDGLDGGEEGGGGAGAAVDEVADGDEFIADAAVDGGEDAAPFEIEPGGFDGGFRGGDDSDGLIDFGFSLIDFLLCGGSVEEGNEAVIV